MNLSDYEKTKFELAEILRSAVLQSGRELSNAPDEVRDMFARLAEDRFNLVVVGRFSRGKTSLMNALLDTDRLPTGIIPLTSVITSVRYGTHEEVFVEYEGSRHLSSHIAIDQLPDYITQQGNPANEKKVAIASIRLPCALLRRGFHFVDTPGIGSSIRENTLTTERFLPEADAFILVTSYDSALSDEEMGLLRHVVPTRRKVFVVLNKQDTVTDSERDQVWRYVRARLAETFGTVAPDIFSVSALNALDANRTKAEARRTGSGMAELRDALVSFLIAEKQRRFLASAVERVAAILAQLPNAAILMTRLNNLRKGSLVNAQRPIEAVELDEVGAARFSPCAMCERIERDLFAFLARYQYEIIVNDKPRAELAERGGLCVFHTWQYHAIASPRGTSIGFFSVLDSVAARLRRIAELSSPSSGIDALHVTEKQCCVCRARKDAERNALLAAASDLGDGKGPTRPTRSFCLPHLRLLIHEVKDADVARSLLVHEAALCERVSEDMRRYALKFDGMRRYLASDEECVAAEMALTLLAGSYNANAARKIR